jgi:serine/threonine protein kinase
MTYQLLSGKLPFNDWVYPLNPRLNVIWNEVLKKEPTFDDKHWNNIDPLALDFVATCLQKDHAKRPIAIECLKHPWLTKTDCTDRFKGTPLMCEPFAYDDNAMTIILP